MEELPTVLQALRSATHLNLEGVATHLASSEVLDAPSVAEQLKNFEAARRLVRDFGFDPQFVHAANTSAVISHHEAWNSMMGLVLPGIVAAFALSPAQAGVLASCVFLGMAKTSDGGDRFYP